MDKLVKLIGEMEEKMILTAWLTSEENTLQKYSLKMDSKFSSLINSFKEKGFREISKNKSDYYWKKYYELKNLGYKKSSLAMVNKMHETWGKEIKVSVIVPVYNVEHYIAKCLDSLVEQSLLELEIIIVDDGSEDSSAEIANQYAEQCSSFVKLVKKKNGGLGSARNAALKFTRGEYIGYVDSDDYVDLKMYEKLYKEAIKGNDIVMCGMTAFNNIDGSIVWKYVLPKDIDLKNMKEVIKNSTIRISPGACNKLFKRSLLERIPWGEGFYEDLQATPTYFSFSQKVSAINECLYFYRVNRVGSIMYTKRNDKRCLSFIKSWENLLKYANPEYQQEIEYAVYIHIVDILKAFPAFIEDYMRYFSENRAIWEDNLLIKELINNKATLDLFNLEIIPKIIHYIEHEGMERTELQNRCVRTWKEYMLDYEFFKWDGSENIVKNKYLRKALRLGNWSYIKDYIKFSKLFEYGGIYLESDVQCNGLIDGLRLNELFLALEDDFKINWGVIGCKKESKIIKKILDLYEKDSFLSNYADKGYTSNLLDSYVWELIKYDSEINVTDDKYLGGKVFISPPNILTIDCNDGLNILERHFEGKKSPFNLDVSYKFYITKNYFYKLLLDEKKMEASLYIRIRQSIKVRIVEILKKFQLDHFVNKIKNKL